MPKKSSDFCGGQLIVLLMLFLLGVSLFIPPVGIAADKAPRALSEGSVADKAPRAYSVGDLQIACESGVKIYIDDQYKGISNNKDDGLFIEGLSTGVHSLKAVREGYNDYVGNININANKTTVRQIEFEGVRENIKKLSPDVEKTRASVGNLEVRSIPYGAKVYIDDKLKGDGDMEIENVATGNHKITFERKGQKLTGNYRIEANSTLKLKGNFNENKIINISK